MSVNPTREDVKELELGSSQWCPVTGQEAMGTMWNGSFKVSIREHFKKNNKKILSYCGHDWALGKVAQRTCGVSLLEGIQKPHECGPGQPALGGCAWADRVQRSLSDLSHSVMLWGKEPWISWGSRTLWIQVTADLWGWCFLLSGVLHVALQVGWNETEGKNLWYQYSTGSWKQRSRLSGKWGEKAACLQQLCLGGLLMLEQRRSALHVEGTHLTEQFPQVVENSFMIGCQSVETSWRLFCWFVLFVEYFWSLA